MDTTITAKQRFQNLLDKMPDDASADQIWDMLDTWYHIDKARASNTPPIPHEEAKQIMAEQLEQKLSSNY